MVPERGVGGQAQITSVPVHPPIPGVSRRRPPSGAAPHPGLPRSRYPARAGQMTHLVLPQVGPMGHAVASDTGAAGQRRVG